MINYLRIAHQLENGVNKMDIEEYMNIPGNEWLRTYIPIKYLYGNVEEEEIHRIFREGKFEIFGATRTPDRSDCYLTIYLNGFINDDTSLNTEPIICRVSLLDPHYLDNPAQPGIKLTKYQKHLFIDFITTHWKEAIEELYYTYDNLDIPIDMDQFRSLKCPNYTTLETID